MKKLLIGLGVFALLGTIMLGVNASAQRYHQYRNGYNTQRYGYKQRPTSYRLRDNERYISRGGRTVSYTRRGTIKTAESTQNIKRIWRGRRHFRPELYRDGLESSRNQGARVIASTQLVPASEFTFDNRLGFAQDQGGIFRSSRTSLAFRAYKVDGSCQKANFSRCVKTVMDNYRREMGVTQLHLQDYSLRQTINDDFSYQLTYRETFVGRDGNLYFVMGLINPNDGAMIRLEAVALPRHEKSATQAMHQVFESFRFIKTYEDIYHQYQDSSDVQEGVNVNIESNAIIEDDFEDLYDY